MAQTAEKVLEFPAGGIADFYMEDDEIEALGRLEAEEAYGTSGIATFPDLAERMASYGRHGDDTVAHVETGELVIPKALIEDNPRLRASIFSHLEELGVEDPERYVVGSGSNSINPNTGLPEFFFRKIGRAVKKTVRKVSRAVKKVGKSVVKLVKKAAPVIIPFALNAMFPGLGAIYSGALGSGIGTLVQGGSLKDAFKNAMIGGAIGGATAAIGGGASAAAKGGSFAEGAMSGIKNAAKLSNLSTAGQQLTSGQFGQSGYDAVTAAAMPDVNTAADVVSLDTDIGANLASNPMDANTRNALYGVNAKPAALTPDMPSPYGPDPMSMGSTGGVGDTSARFTSGVPTSGASSLNIATPTTPSSFMDTVSEYSTKAGDYLFRGGQSQEAIAGNAELVRQKAITNYLDNLPAGINPNSAAVQSAALKAGDAAAAAAKPGTLATFGPSLALAGGAAYLGGGFTTPEVEEEDFGPTGEELRRMYPEKYGFSNQESPRRSNQPTYVESSFKADPRFMYPEFRRGNPFYNPDSVYQRRAEGGEIFPRRVGGIMPDEGIPGKDSVRAMLMPGEFVMTTDAVKGLGNGNNQQGIQNMYQMMRGLEAKGKAIA